MSAPSAAPGKITYTSSTADMESFHAAFDAALLQVRAEAGRVRPMLSAGRESLRPPLYAKRSPVDGTLLAKFPLASRKAVDEAVGAARAARKAWGAVPWPERAALVRRAAALIRERKFRIAAIVALEVGKNRLESMGDVEEAADLLDYYAGRLEEARGYEIPLGRLLPNENTRSVLRPYGVFACIAPFNFPISLSAGMSGAALLGGNAVVYKPSLECPWTGLEFVRCCRDAGIPEGALQMVTGDGPGTGEALWKHPGIDGVVFTGSREVGLRIHRGLSRSYVKPALMELGGKNPAYVAASADLEAAASGVVRSAFGLQGQKCSACSRVYVHASVYEPFRARLLDKVRELSVGDPTRRGVFMGPLIHERALKTYLGAVRSAKRGGKMLCGGGRLAGPGYPGPLYVSPAVAELPLSHELFSRELFAPFLAVAKVPSLDRALELCNASEYGLTAGIFSADPAEVRRFFDEVESGVCYANRATGATTGAWPGVQAFCGWKGSGSTGKGGCGPHYVAQFMREQSRTVME